MWLHACLVHVLDSACLPYTRFRKHMPKLPSTESPKVGDLHVAPSYIPLGKIAEICGTYKFIDEEQNMVNT